MAKTASAGPDAIFPASTAMPAFSPNNSPAQFSFFNRKSQPRTERKYHEKRSGINAFAFSDEKTAIPPHGEIREKYTYSPRIPQ